MFQVGRFPLVASGVLFGGLMLGTALASYARPVPVEPQPAPWAGVLHPPIHVGESHANYDSPPEEVAVPGGYAPAIAFTTLKWWPSDLRLPREANYAPAPQPAVQAVPQYVPDNYQEVQVQVPHYAAIEQSAQQAQDAAQQATEQAPPPAPTETGGAKVINVAEQLAKAG